MVFIQIGCLNMPSINLKKLRFFFLLLEHFLNKVLIQGDNCCSDSSISFHYMSEKDMLNLKQDNRSKRFFNLNTK